jgi:hypothetical protein
MDRLVRSIRQSIGAAAAPRWRGFPQRSSVQRRRYAGATDMTSAAAASTSAQALRSVQRAQRGSVATCAARCLRQRL